MANDLTLRVWHKEDSDGAVHSVTITEETIAPEGLDETGFGYGKRVTVSQSVILAHPLVGTANGSHWHHYPDVTMVYEVESWATYDARMFKFMEKLEKRGFEFAYENERQASVQDMLERIKANCIHD